MSGLPYVVEATAEAHAERANRDLRESLAMARAQSALLAVNLDRCRELLEELWDPSPKHRHAIRDARRALGLDVDGEEVSF